MTSNDGELTFALLLQLPFGGGGHIVMEAKYLVCIA
jgi:hypothetical protein